MPYHHGGLRTALVDAGLELARTGGPDAVVLRAATRHAGVSHNAAYRHFADKDALLRAVCERCMRELAVRMEQRIDALVASGDERDDAWGALAATGRAYIQFALAEPGWFRTAFAVPPDAHGLAGGEGVGDSGLGPYQLLGLQLDRLRDAGVIRPEHRSGLEYAAWSAVHGISSLLVDGPLREVPADERERAIATVLGVITRGLPG